MLSNAQEKKFTIFNSIPFKKIETTLYTVYLTPS